METNILNEFLKDTFNFEESPFMKATELYSLRLKAQEIEDKNNGWLHQ